MIRHCPHCDIILLEYEWQTGACVCCHGPLSDPVPAEPSPGEVPPPAPPAPPKRNRNVLWLRGAVIASLIIVAVSSWRFSRPTDRKDAPRQDERAEVVPVPSGDTVGVKDTRAGQKKTEEPKPRPNPEPVKEPPRRTTEGGKPPEETTRQKTPPLDKELAIAFAAEILTATNILAEKYYRELDGDQLIVWAIRGLFQGVREPLPPALEQRLRKKPREGLDRLDLLVDAREMLGSRQELVAPRDADLALQSIFRRLDPYTTLLDADAMTRMSLQQNGGRVGELGLLVRRQQQGEAVEVVTPYKDGPAYKAGIRAGDVITRVRLLDGLDGKALAVPEEIAPGTLLEGPEGRAFWGPLGSRVEVSVSPRGGDRPQVYSLTRARVKKEKLLGIRRRADDSWDHLLDPKKGIYYIRITDFHGPETGKELDLLLKGFGQPKLKGLVLDLRFSGSGLIQTAFDVADLFIPNGLIVEFRSRNLQGGKGRWMSRGKGSHTSVPLVCLINAETGTCTEIVAAALQDLQRARIVGERTSGKASAQNYFAIERGTLRITTSSAYRPNGKPLDRMLAQERAPDKEGVLVPATPSEDWGVTPDRALEVFLSEEERSALRERLRALVRLSRPSPEEQEPRGFRDRQLEKARDLLQGDAKECIRRLPLPPEGDAPRPHRRSPEIQPPHKE
jgi:carboxyl-terminal processing protease